MGRDENEAADQALNEGIDKAGVEINLAGVLTDGPHGRVLRQFSDSPSRQRKL